MTTPPFEEAVKIAKYMIAPHLIGPGESDRTTLTGLAAWRAAQFDTTTDAGYTAFRAERHGATMLLASPEHLIEAAKTDYFHFLALTRGVANVIELGWPIPECIQIWLSHYLRGEKNPPVRPQQQPTKDVRYFKIFCTVEVLLGKGLKLSRSKSSESGTTACDAVATANNELGLAPRSYSRILEIYYQEKGSAETTDIALSAELSEVIQITSGTTS